MNQNNTHLNPLFLQYMKVVSVCLKSVDSWPTEILMGKKPKFKILRTWLVCQALLIITGQMYFLKLYFHILPFFLLGDLYALMFLAMLTLYRCLLPASERYGLLITRFVKNFHLIHFTYKGGAYEMIYNNINNICNKFTFLMASLMASALILFNITPLYKNIQNGVFSNRNSLNSTAEFSIHCQWPGYIQDDHIIVSTIFNTWVSYTCCILVCANDLMLSIMVFQLIGHLQVLNYNLKHFPRPKQQFARINDESGGIIEYSCFSDEENKLIKSKIIECVDHHRFIVSFAKEVSTVYGPMLGFNYLYHLGGLCLLLLVCTSGEPDAIPKYGPLTMIILGQLIQISVTFEIVGSTSEKTIGAVYDVPWECMNVSNQRSIQFLLSRVQTTIHVTAMGLTSVGVQTMLQILKTTISYFAFLRSIDM